MKNDRFRLENGHFFEIRQLCFLAAIKVKAWRLGHRSDGTYVLAHLATRKQWAFAVDELNFCVRNGNRWILVAIITGMAPLVGLEGKSGMK